MIIGNKYRLIRRLGEGGSGCVYLAEDINLHKNWAIKKIKKCDSLTDYKREILVLSKLEHPLLPRIVDVVMEEEEVYLVMDYIRGITLQKQMDMGMRFSLKQVKKMGSQLCDVLGYLHSKNPPIVYGDLNPSNVILTLDGSIRLVDFGISREQSTFELPQKKGIGTKGFASPEQYRGIIEERSDIYSLGILLNYMLSRRLTRRAGPFYFRRIIKKCTSKKPERRYLNIHLLKNQLEKKPNSKLRIFLLLLFILLIIYYQSHYK